MTQPGPLRDLARWCVKMALGIFTSEMKCSERSSSCQTLILFSHTLSWGGLARPGLHTSPGAAAGTRYQPSAWQVNAT